MSIVCYCVYEWNKCRGERVWKCILWRDIHNYLHLNQETHTQLTARSLIKLSNVNRAQILPKNNHMYITKCYTQLYTNIIYIITINITLQVITYAQVHKPDANQHDKAANNSNKDNNGTNVSTSMDQNEIQK